MKQFVLLTAFVLTAIVGFSGGYDVGDKATDFNLKNVDGTWVSLSDYGEANGFIVIFTCNHCPYAKKYEQRIIDLDKKYKSKGYPVIAINPNDPEVQPEDSFANMQQRAEEKGFTFPYLFDAKQEIYPHYGATKTPHVFLLKKENGSLIVKYIGAIDDNYKSAEAAQTYYVRDAVDALLAGNEIPKKNTKAIGCSIKTK